MATNVVAGSEHDLNAGITSLLGKEQKSAETRYKNTIWGVGLQLSRAAEVRGIILLPNPAGIGRLSRIGNGKRGLLASETQSRVTHCPKCHLNFRLLQSLCGPYTLVDHFPTRDIYVRNGTHETEIRNRTIIMNS